MEISDGPQWEPPLDVAGLEHLLAGLLRRFAEGERCWGIRNIDTGGIYPFGSSVAEVEVVRKGTVSPGHYEIVHQRGSEWVAAPDACVVIGSDAGGTSERPRLDACSLESGESARHNAGPPSKDGGVT